MEKIYILSDQKPPNKKRKTGKLSGEYTHKRAVLFSVFENTFKRFSHLGSFI